MPSPAPQMRSRNDTNANVIFTIMNRERYVAVMLIAAAAILAGSAPQNAPAEHRGPVVQAIAMVRVISGVALRLDGTNNGAEVPAPRETVFTAGGVQSPARLIEFQ
jgi:hypothetical protein